MKKRRTYTVFISLTLALLLLLVGCSESEGTGSSSSAGAATPNTSTTVVKGDWYTEDDLYIDWQTETYETITLNGSSISYSGQNATVSGSTIVINAGGTYVVSGTLTDGQIIVDESAGKTVRIVLNGADITSSNSAPIYVKQVGKAIISLSPGTSNTLTDGDTVYSDAAEEEPSATLFSKDDLTINGTGSLRINANFNDGITCKDDLRILDATIEIISIDDGIVGRDMAGFVDVNITIDAVGDGIKSTHDTDTEKGFVIIESGTFKLTTYDDGIKAETDVVISGGTFDLETRGGSGATTGTSSDTTSAKGIKGNASVTISGGSFTIDSVDDAIHSNGNVSISGGTFSIQTGDDGVHADGTLTISDGTINILKSYEGLEAAVIEISGGEISVVSSDDGINVAGGADSSGFGGRPGEGGFQLANGQTLTISGGFVVIDASGDGIDINGDGYMTGGTVIVNGPTSGADAALDYDGTFEISGGTLVAAGSSGMALTPSSGSSQASVQIGTSGQGGTTISLLDNSGSFLLAFTPIKSYQNVVISTPSLVQGGSYSVSVGGTVAGNAEHGLYLSGSLSGGQTLGNFTVSSYLSSVGSTSGGMGGTGPGGNQGEWR